MAKLSTYLLIIMGIMAMMYYGGLIDNSSTILTLLLDPINMSFSDFFSNQIIVAVQLLGLGAITIGALSLRDPSLFVFGAVMIFLFDLGFNFLQVYQKLVSINPNFTSLAILLFAPLLFLFGITCIEWWGNKP